MIVLAHTIQIMESDEKKQTVDQVFKSYPDYKNWGPEYPFSKALCEKNAKAESATATWKLFVGS